MGFLRYWIGLPTFAAAAGNPNVIDELLKGKEIGGRTYKNHLDGYNQMAAITGKGQSARHEISISAKARSARSASTTTSSASSTSQPAGSGRRRNPTCRTSPICGSTLQRTGWPNDGTKEGGQQYFDWFKYQFWRFVFV